MFLVSVREDRAFCKSHPKCYLGTGTNAFSSAGSSSGLVYDDGNHPFL